MIVSLPQRQDSATLNPAVAYLQSLNASSSERTMRYNLHHVARLMGRRDLLDCDWRALRRVHCQKVIEQLRLKNYACSTINLYICALKGVAREAWSRGLLPHSAYVRILNIKAIRGSRLPAGRSLTLRECRRIFSSCDETQLRGCRDKALFAVMLGCGMRRTEVVTLNVDQWNPDEGSFVFIGKGNKERKTFLPPDLHGMIETWIKRRGEEPGPLFPRVYSRQKIQFLDFSASMAPSSIYRIVQKQYQRAKLSKISPHDLRRTFATRSLDAGVDIFALQKAMGHASPATTARYDRRGEDSLRKAAKALRF